MRPDRDPATSAGRRYPEREVCELLATDAPDVATLRRLLVAERFLERDHGSYWRP